MAFLIGRSLWNNVVNLRAENLVRDLGIRVDPDGLLDSHVKWIHENKRQLLNVRRVIIRYHRRQDDPHRDYTPRTVFFAGKVAAAYRFAKLIIKTDNNVSAVV